MPKKSSSNTREQGRPRERQPLPSESPETKDILEEIHRLQKERDALEVSLEELSARLQEIDFSDTSESNTQKQQEISKEIDEIRGKLSQIRVKLSSLPRSSNSSSGLSATPDPTDLDSTSKVDTDGDDTVKTDDLELDDTLKIEDPTEVIHPFEGYDKEPRAGKQYVYDTKREGHAVAFLEVLPSDPLDFSVIRLQDLVTNQLLSPTKEDWNSRVAPYLRELTDDDSVHIAELVQAAEKKLHRVDPKDHSHDHDIHKKEGKKTELSLENIFDILGPGVLQDIASDSAMLHFEKDPDLREDLLKQITSRAKNIFDGLSAKKMERLEVMLQNAGYIRKGSPDSALEIFIDGWKSIKHLQFVEVVNEYTSIEAQRLRMLDSSVSQFDREMREIKELGRGYIANLAGKHFGTVVLPAVIATGAVFTAAASGVWVPALVGGLASTAVRRHYQREQWQEEQNGKPARGIISGLRSLWGKTKEVFTGKPDLDEVSSPSVFEERRKVIDACEQNILAHMTSGQDAKVQNFMSAVLKILTEERHIIDNPAYIHEQALEATIKAEKKHQKEKHEHGHDAHGHGGGHGHGPLPEARPGDNDYGKEKEPEPLEVLKLKADRSLFLLRQRNPATRSYTDDMRDATNESRFFGTGWNALTRTIEGITRTKWGLYSQDTSKYLAGTFVAGVINGTLGATILTVGAGSFAAKALIRGSWGFFGKGFEGAVMTRGALEREKEQALMQAYTLLQDPSNENLLRAEKLIKRAKAETEFADLMKQSAKRGITKGATAGVLGAGAGMVFDEVRHVWHGGESHFPPRHTTDSIVQNQNTQPLDHTTHDVPEAIPPVSNQTHLSDTEAAIPDAQHGMETPSHTLEAKALADLRDIAWTPKETGGKGVLNFDDALLHKNQDIHDFIIARERAMYAESPRAELQARANWSDAKIIHEWKVRLGEIDGKISNWEQGLHKGMFTKGVTYHPYIRPDGTVGITGDEAHWKDGLFKFGKAPVLPPEVHFNIVDPYGPPSESSVESHSGWEIKNIDPGIQGQQATDWHVPKSGIHDGTVIWREVVTNNNVGNNQTHNEYLRWKENFDTGDGKWISTSIKDEFARSAGAHSGEVPYSTREVIQNKFHLTESEINHIEKTGYLKKDGQYYTRNEAGDITLLSKSGGAISTEKPPLRATLRDAYQDNIQKVSVPIYEKPSHIESLDDTTSFLNTKEAVKRFGNAPEQIQMLRNYGYILENRESLYHTGALERFVGEHFGVDMSDHEVQEKMEPVLAQLRQDHSLAVKTFREGMIDQSKTAWRIQRDIRPYIAGLDKDSISAINSGEFTKNHLPEDLEDFEVRTLKKVLNPTLDDIHFDQATKQIDKLSSPGI